MRVIPSHPERNLRPKRPSHYWLTACGTLFLAGLSTCGQDTPLEPVSHAAIAFSGTPDEVYRGLGSDDRWGILTALEDVQIRIIPTLGADTSVALLSAALGEMGEAALSQDDSKLVYLASSLGRAQEALAHIRAIDPVNPDLVAVHLALERIHSTISGAGPAAPMTFSCKASDWPTSDPRPAAACTDDARRQP